MGEEIANNRKHLEPCFEDGYEKYMRAQKNFSSLEKYACIKQTGFSSCSRTVSKSWLLTVSVASIIAF